MSDTNDILVQTIQALVGAVNKLNEKLDGPVEPAPQPEQPVKKKRGRPRKNAQTPSKRPKQVRVEEDAELADDEMDAAEFFQDSEDFEAEDDDIDEDEKPRRRIRSMSAGLPLGPRKNEFNPKQYGFNSDKALDEKLLAPFKERGVERATRKKAKFIRIRCKECRQLYKEPQGPHLHPNWKCNACIGGAN